ncbi:MAG TPA: acyl-CoA dehydrogenase family protein, partial [Vicinamibacterales bacterium]|nr:acyl-CoA dehydrogenase family protein [Vicinamibacterales bacterium]
MNFEFTPDQIAFRDAAARFASVRVAPEAARIDREDAFPREVIAEAAAAGLCGVTIAREWGGAGQDYIAYALALEAVARASATVAVILAVNNSLVAEPIDRFGSPEQKETWLRDVVTGKSLGVFALSEEHAGTDAANQRTVAALDANGYVLNGRKVWIANAQAADFAIVFAATHPGLRGRGISAFLVPLDTPGVDRRVSADSLGVRGLGCMDLELRDVRIDAGAMLGARGEGFRIALWALDGGRVAIAAQALGVGAAALGEALAHAKQRETFGQPIANYQAIQWMLADMATELEAARVLMWQAADARSRQPSFRIEAAMAKLAASEAAHRAADKAMQILASAGYRRGSTV